MAAIAVKRCRDRVGAAEDPGDRKEGDDKGAASTRQIGQRGILNARMTCQKCRVPMRQENHAHLSHGKRKWRCPACKRVRMQKPKEAKTKSRPDTDQATD